MKTSQRLIKNFASLTAAEIITRLAATLLYVYIARTLGVTSFGQLAFATALMGFFNFFADFGMTTLGTREIARNKDRKDSYGTNILFFQLLLTIILIIILSLILVWIPITTKLKIITFFYGLGLIPLSLDMSYIFQAFEKMEYVLIAKIVNQFSYLLLGFFFISIFKDITFIPIAYCIGGVLGALTTYIILMRSLHFSLSQLDTALIKSLIITALPFVAAGLFGNIYHNLDSIMIQFFKNTNQVGYYASGYKIVNISIMVISFIANSFFPLISLHYKNDSQKFQKFLQYFSQAIGLIAIPAGVGCILYAKQIITFFYGSSFLPAQASFIALSLLIILIPFNILLSTILIASDQQKENMISTAIGAIVDIILNFLLIPHFGIVGAAIATIASEVGVCSYLLLSYQRKLPALSSLVSMFFTKPLLASFAMVAIILMFHIHNLFVGICIAAMIYFSAMLLLKGIPSEFINMLLHRQND